MTTKIAITTPTGKNGRAVTERLLDVAREKHLEILLLARDPEKVLEFSERGATVEKGSLDDVGFVARATEGVDALFWITPANFEPGEEVRAGYNRYGRVAAEVVNYDPSIHATATLTLALPKRGFREPSARAAVGELYLADIGVPPELYAGLGLEPPVDAIFAQDDIVRLW